MSVGNWKRGVAALGLVIGVSAGMPLSGHASGGSGCASGQWTVMPSPQHANDSMFHAVAAFSPTDVWAAGLEYQDPSGKRLTDTVFGELYEHWDGTTWSNVPGPGVTGGLINALAGVSTSDLWAFGSVEGEGSLTEHWDGHAWQAVSDRAPLSGQLFGGVAIAGDDVWAAGTAQNALGTTGFVEHWNGVQWSLVKTFAGSALWTVAATGDNNIWVAAGSGSEHWDGRTWTSVAAAAAGTATGWQNTVTIAPTGETWAGGYSYDPANGDTYTDIQSWNGSNWTDTPLGSHQPGAARFYGMSAASATDVWAVGYETSPQSAPIAEHWNGSQWTSIPPVDSSGIDFVSAVSALPGQAWAVGQTWNNAIQREQPLIETYCS